MGSEVGSGEVGKWDLWYNFCYERDDGVDA